MNKKDKDFLEKILKELESKIFNSFNLNQAVFILEKKENKETDFYSEQFLGFLSQKVDRDGVLLRDYYHLFERVYFLVKDDKIKIVYFHILLNYYYEKIHIKKEYERLVINLLSFSSKKLEELDNKFIEKLPSKTILDFLKSLFKKNS